MKTVKYRISGTHKIIVGFGRLTPDPEATRANCKAEAEGLAEYTSAKNKNAEIESNRKMITQFMTDARLIYNGVIEAQPAGFTVTRDAVLALMDKSKYAQFLKKEEMLAAHRSQGAILQNELLDIHTALEGKITEILTSNPVYFEPVKDEMVLEVGEQAKAEGLIDGLAKNKSLSISDSGAVSEIDNFAGKKYFTLVDGVWTVGVIDVAGVAVPTGGILEGTLSVAQMAEIQAQDEADRVGLLTAGEKADELAMKTDNLASEALERRGKLEIQGVSTALADSQAWYETELAILTSLYA
jgi:hypothetical protein